MLSKEKYSEWLQKELADAGISAPKETCDKIAAKLAKPAKLWAEQVAEPEGNGEEIDKLVTAHLFLGIALTGDSFPYNPSAKQFAYDICEGDIIGEFESLDSFQLKHKQILGAQLAIGNDGSWFGE